MYGNLPGVHHSVIDEMAELDANKIDAGSMAMAIEYGRDCYKDKYKFKEETFAYAVEYFTKHVDDSRGRDKWDSYLSVAVLWDTQPLKDYFKNEMYYLTKHKEFTEEHWETMAQTVWVMDDCYS